MREEFTRNGQTWDIWFPDQFRRVAPTVHKQLKLGDEVWYIPGIRNSSLILIRCKIVGIEDSFRKENSDAYLYYDLDEPVGHYVDFDDVYLEVGEAKEVLKQMWRAVKEEIERGYSSNYEQSYRATLSDFRESRKKFITSTWEYPPVPGELQYVDKEPKKDWFNVAMLYEH